MKKNIIALLLSIVMVVGSFSGTPVLAAETTAEAAVAVEENTVDSEEVAVETEEAATDEIVEDTSVGEATKEIEAEPEQDLTETVEETEEAETIEDEEEAIESEAKEATLAEGDVVGSGTCGENVTWTLTRDNYNYLTLTISGNGDMSNPSPSWYLNKNSIKTVIIENGVTSINARAFYECTSLTSITIPDSVTSMGSHAFYKCTSLTSITIPDSVTSMGSHAFYNCSSLTSITIPDSVISIGEYSFHGCNSLTSITIPDSVTSIGAFSFEGCSSLTSITIPDSVTSIGQNAFYKCSSLTSVTIPGSVTSIGSYAFDQCGSLEYIYFKGNAPQLSSNVFFGVTATAYYPIDDTTWTEDKKQNYGGEITWILYDPETIGVIEIDPEFTCNMGEQIQISATYRGTTEITSATVSADPDDALEFSEVSILGPVDNGNGQEMIISFMVTANKGGDYNLTLTASDGASASTILKVIDEYDISDAEAVIFGATYTDEEGNKCFNYTGESIEPVYTVRFSNKPVAEKDKDYTMTYEDNTEIGIARCILEGIGDYHGQKIVEFRIVAPRPEFISIESEFPGACTIVVNKLSKSAAYKLDIQKDGKSIKGYPKELVDDENPDGSSATDSFTEYVDCLEEGLTYTIRCCAIAKIDGKDYQSDWREREVEISSVKMTTESGYDEFFAPIQSITLELDFGKEDISFTGEGQIAIHDDTDNKDVWVFVPSKETPTIQYDCEECPGENAKANDSKLTIIFNTTFYPKELDGSDFEGNIRLKADHKYHVSVKDGTILHGDKKIWAGIDNKDKLCFKTIKYQLPRYRNTGFEHHYSLAKEMAEQIYKPSHVLPIILHSYLDRGICTGMLQTILAWEKGYDNIHQIGNQVEDLGDLHKNETGGTNTSFRDYMIKAQLYSMSPDWVNQKKPHDGDLNGIYQKASRGDDFIISFGSYSTTDEDTINHVLLPVGVKNNNSYDSIMVYDCSINDSKAIIKELRLAKSGGTYTGWALGGLGSDQANNYITWFELTDGMDQCVVENKQNLVYATEKLSHEAEGDLTNIRPANSISGYEDEGYLYWTDKNNLSFAIEAGSLVSLSDGYNKLEAFAGKDAQVIFNLETMATNVITEEASDEQTVELGYQIYTDYDESTKIKVTAGGSEQTTLKQTDDGWTLEGAQPGTITITMESEGVEDGEEITNTEEITVESTTGSVEMENDSDQTLHVYEDADGNGSMDTEIGTVAIPEQPGVISIAEDSVSGIEEKEYTGNAVTQEPVVTVRGKTLESGTNYTVSYENNINVGTAKVIITGIGKYTGTIEKEFEIAAKEVTPAITLSTKYFTYTGKIQKPNVTVKDGDTELTAGRDYTIKFAGDCTSPMPQRLVVDLKGNYTGRAIASFQIGRASITLANETYVFTGKAIKPTLTVKFGSKELTTSDYDVIWPSGCTNVGTYTVTVKLKGAYSGAVTKSYAITAKKITPTVTLTPTKFVYNGKVRRPTVTVKNGSTKLAASNYTVSYASGRKNPGAYKVTVKLKGNFSGTKTVSFRIIPKGTTLVKLTPASKKMAVKWKKQATQITGYQIQYATDSKFTKNKKTVTVKGATKTSKTITGLTGGKKYYVRIRTYKTVSKVNYYSAWSAKKAVTVKK